MTQGYVRPETYDAALAALADSAGGSKVLGGGTDLMIHLRAGKQFPTLVNVSRIPELQRVRVVEGQLELGAMVTVALLLRDPAVRQHAPLLVQAADHFASPLVRSRATLGGNLINASPAADLTLALLALDARVLLASRGDTRTLKVDELVLGPGKTALKPGELVEAVRVPVAKASQHFHFEKSGPRPALEISVVAVATSFSLEGGKVSQPRIACGAVAPVPLRATPAEALLDGKALTPELIEQAARAAANFVRPIDDVRATALYRRRLVAAFVRRCLSAALDSSKVPHA
jgi:CO/xanthine dehydrogenase FAD-binding subunit